MSPRCEAAVLSIPNAPGLAFAHLNLRRNPFGELPLDERGALAVVDLAETLDRLTDSAAAVQFVGACGHGKTTHLLAIAHRCPAAGYVHLPETGRRPPIPSGSPVLVDEAQRLTRRQRQRLFREPRPVVLGTHVDFARELTAAGRRVHTVTVADHLSAERLAVLLNRRIWSVRRTHGPTPVISIDRAAQLLQHHGPDVRAIEAELYLHFQDPHGIDHGQMQHSDRL